MVGRPGIKEVAAASGVSIKTVSRVVNGESSVRPATRSRVRAAIDELGYIPNTAARSLKSGTGRVIGIVIDSLADPFFAALVSAIERRALGEGLGIVVASTGQDVDREREQLLLLLSGHRAAGVIFAPVTDSHPYLQAYRESTPIVAVDRAHPDFDSVVVDDFEATRTAIGQLVNNGHRRIAFLYREQRYGAISRRYCSTQSLSCMTDPVVMILQMKTTSPRSIGSFRSRPRRPRSLPPICELPWASSVHYTRRAELVQP